MVSTTSSSLVVADLITHRFPIEKAPEAYELIERREEPCVGVVLTYSAADEASAGAPVRVRAPAAGGATGVGLVGAGAFASTVLVPGLKAAGWRLPARRWRRWREWGSAAAESFLSHDPAYGFHAHRREPRGAV